MKNTLNYYFLAFKKIFDYKTIATRKELNWFLLFMLIFWILLSAIPYGIMQIQIINNKEFFALTQFVPIFVLAITYSIIHAFPLISLVKRRFNCIALSKSKLFFNIWLVNFLIILVLYVALFLLINKGNINMVKILPVFFICYVGGLLHNVIIIFLMIREKPIS